MKAQSPSIQTGQWLLRHVGTTEAAPIHTSDRHPVDLWLRLPEPAIGKQREQMRGINSGYRYKNTFHWAAGEGHRDLGKYSSGWHSSLRTHHCGCKCQQRRGCSLSATSVASLCCSPSSLILPSSTHFGPSSSAGAAYCTCRIETLSCISWPLMWKGPCGNAIHATLLSRVRFGLWKAKAPLEPGFQYLKDDGITRKKKRKKSKHFPPCHGRGWEPNFLAWLLSCQTSAQVRGNCLSSWELEAGDWHLLKWNTPHSLHFFIKPQAFSSS